jgi:phosphatidylserine/phosphatidylglycerophosphate/cardiolipin synthase-like enzyme
VILKTIALIFAMLVAFPALAFDAVCSVYFSPHGGVTDALVALVGTSSKYVRVLAYNFTSQPFGDALIAANKRGVDVQLVLDKSVPTERNSMLPAMLAAGIPAWIDHKHQIAHNKVIVIDGTVFETGSFNYSSNAENNNGENALICQSIDGAAAYLGNFEIHKSHSEAAQ